MFEDDQNYNESMELIQVASSLLEIIRLTTKTVSIQVNTYDSDEFTMMSLDEMEHVIDREFNKLG